MILAPHLPCPAHGKFKVDVENASEAIGELLDFFHEQSSEWHPGEIEYLLRVVTANYLQRKGLTCPPTTTPSPEPSTSPKSTIHEATSKALAASSAAKSQSGAKRRKPLTSKHRR